MDEPNIQSSLAGVVIRLWDNEKNIMIVWQSAEPPFEPPKRKSHHPTKKDKRKKDED